MLLYGWGYPWNQPKIQPLQISMISKYFQIMSRRQTYGSYPPFWAVPSDLSWSGGPACGRPPDTPWSDCGTGGARWREATRYRSTHGSCLQTLVSTTQQTAWCQSYMYIDLRPLYTVLILVICQKHVCIM